MRMPTRISFVYIGALFEDISMWRLTLAIGLSIVITSAGISQQAVSVEPKLPDVQTQNNGATTAQAASQTQSQTQFKQTVAYWTAEGSWHTELHLRNNMGTAPLLVVPVLHSASGERVHASRNNRSAEDREDG
jgi:hypothetical protein